MAKLWKGSGVSPWSPARTGLNKRQSSMKTIPVCLLLSGLLIPVIALGEPVPGGAPDGRPGGGDRGDRGQKSGGPAAMMEGWKLADTNGDGFVSRLEFDAMPRLANLEEEKRQALFARLDKDGDGKLSKDEIGRMIRPPNGDVRPPMPRLSELDTDNSGGVSLEEFRKGEFFKKLPPERQEVFFRRLDTDGDGEITPKDRPQMPQPRGGEGRRPGRPEGDRRGGDRPPGAGGPRDLRGILSTLDKNGDGKVDFDEFRQAPHHQGLGEDEQEDRFEALDANKDLVLDAADLPEEKERGPRDGRRPEGP